jgi:hypothetical protein
VLGLSLSDGSPSCAKAVDPFKPMHGNTLAITDDRKIWRMKKTEAP